jgi:predicted transcriptional regulator
MSVLTVTIASREEVTRRVLAAFSGQGVRNEQLSFPTPELLWKVLGAKRWELLKSMAGKGPMTVRGAARAVKRDVKAVHGDVHALLDAGVIERAEDGKIVFPYDAIHVDFMLRAA